ncbi:MAG: exodeoxyribonuclease VII small subunit [Anaerolineaceae bacterium]|nr:exodeoxyribonuclease VII small subunit [Anaerolineaceae bacterium]|tara:strand:+ start:1163 stop:1372 length:210 start_codon:yes stop_codon:yes gene_type:complete
MGKSREPESLDFEASLTELESIVSKLENNQLSLQESLQLYKRGELLSKRCNQLLDEAELQIDEQFSSDE